MILVNQREPKYMKEENAVDSNYRLRITPSFWHACAGDTGQAVVPVRKALT